jgi:hypothetical protein
MEYFGHPWTRTTPKTMTTMTMMTIMRMMTTMMMRHGKKNISKIQTTIEGMYTM